MLYHFPHTPRAPLREQYAKFPWRDLTDANVKGDLRAWQRGQTLAVQGWIYKVQDGLLRDLSICITQPNETAAAYQAATSREKGLT